MLTEFQKYKAAEYCSSFVAGMFANMHNPEYRGDKFTWGKFPDMVAGLVKAQIFIIFYKKPKNLIEIEDWAFNRAKGIAESLLHAAGYVPHG